MVAILGDENGNARGSFALIDSTTFTVKGSEPTPLNNDLNMTQANRDDDWFLFSPGNWEQEPTPFGYGFWYQPYHNVMVSSEWGAPMAIMQGFRWHHVKDGALTFITAQTSK
jgi:selenium-binding protein 1